jgi:serine/threonine-protein kinase RsbW
MPRRRCGTLPGGALRSGPVEGHLRTMPTLSTVDEIQSVQSALHEEMARLGYGADACFAVRLAVEEAVVNAVKHGHKFNPDLVVRVEYEVDARRVCIRVKDQGRGFKPEEVPDPTSDENLAKPTGRGILLMRAYMDEVAYSACGTEVTMVKKKA